MAMNAKLIWEEARKLSRVPGAFALYKLFTKLIYRDGSVVVVRRGPLAGLKWRHYGCYQAWMAAGLYEPHVASLIRELLKPGDVFYDIGANAGYFTLLGARAVGTTGQVIAFDPNPRNAKTIREQAALNGSSLTVVVEGVAVSDSAGTFDFVVTRVNANAHLVGRGAGHLVDKGEVIEVHCTTLDEYVQSHRRPTVVKMDIEGAEVDALRGAAGLLGSGDAPIMLVSTHGADLAEQCEAILSKAGYFFKKLEGFSQMILALPPRLGPRGGRTA